MTGVYFENSEKNQESARRGREKANERHRTKHGKGSKDESYAKVCPGCGRAVRAPSQSKEAFPDTIMATRKDGTCQTCLRQANDVKSKTQRSWSSLSPEEQDERVRRGRAEYEALVRSRRARGIHPDGIVFPGDGIPIRTPESRLELRRQNHAAALERRRQREAERSRRRREERARVPREPRPHQRRKYCPLGHVKAEIYRSDGTFKKHRCYQCEWLSKKAKMEKVAA